MEKPAGDPFQRSRDAQKKGMHGLQGTGGGISLAWEEPHLLRTWTRKLMQGFRSQKGSLGGSLANNCCQLLRVKKTQGWSSCREGESWKSQEKVLGFLGSREIRVGLAIPSVPP